MSSVGELERDIAATRSRLNDTIDRIQSRLTVSGIVDEVMGQAGVPKLASGHEAALSLLKRYPLPTMVVAAGIGFAIYQMNRRAVRGRLPSAEGPPDRLASFDPDGRRLRTPDLSLSDPRQEGAAGLGVVQSGSRAADAIGDRT